MQPARHPTPENNLSISVSVNPSVLGSTVRDGGPVEFVSAIALMNNKEIGNVVLAMNSDVSTDTHSSFVSDVINGAARRSVGDKLPSPYVQVNGINVLEEHRRRGIGTALLHEALVPLESNSMIRVRVSDQISPEWFLHRGFYRRNHESVLESPCLYAVQACIQHRREQPLRKQLYYELDRD
jgi:hypothetical protein